VPSPDGRFATPAPEGLRAQLVAQLPSLPSAQKRLALYLLENLATASDLRITDLAEEAGVSTGSISLLCRRLGLQGYQDLRLGWAREAVLASLVDGRAILKLPDGDETSPGSIEHAIAHVFGTNAEALAESARNLDRAAVDEAVARIAAARHVEWVGVGTAGLVAVEGALKLRKLGIDAIAHVDGHQQAMSASVLTHEDVLVAVSHSGRTTDVLRCARLALGCGAGIVAITAVGSSPLASLAPIVLGTVSYDTAFQVEPMASTVAELSVVQLLFILLLERGGKKAQESLARTQRAVEPLHQTGRVR
jgi:DNA-binding MurR/RpiR family transcriptional regulator